jgi:hypothetical protein
MPYRVTVEKFMAAVGEYWTNVYWTETNDMAIAIAAGNDIVNAEKAIHSSLITITKFRVDDGQANTEISDTTVLNVAGTWESNLADLMPLFVVGRVDFKVVGGGRPSRKYLRGVFIEQEATMASITAPAIARLQTYATAIAAANVCDPQGQQVSSGAPFPAPAMRQLRRGSKKKVTP